MFMQIAHSRCRVQWHKENELFVGVDGARTLVLVIGDTRPRKQTVQAI